MQPSTASEPITLLCFIFFSFKFVLIENATEKNGRQNGKMDNDAAR